MTGNQAVDFLQVLYRLCLRRDADNVGLDWFKNLLLSGRSTYEDVVSAVMESEEYREVNGIYSRSRAPAPRPMPRVCFLHIEKTAGTSFHDYLLELYGPEQIFPERLDRLPDYPESAFGQYCLYSGHYLFSDCYRMPTDTQFVTFCRDPRERVLSLYHFWRSLRSGADLAHLKVAQKRNLADFLRHEDCQTSINNIQMARLVATGMPYTVEEACKSLSTFAFVGLKEHYSISVLLLAHHFGWPPPSRPYRRLSPEELRDNPNHKNVERTPLSPKAEELLERCTRHDWRVYDCALKRLGAEFRTVFGVELTTKDTRNVPSAC